MTQLFNAGFAAYFLALLCAILHLTSRKGVLDKICMGLLAAGWAAQTAYIGVRWLAAGRPPFSNMFESLVLLAWTVALIYLVLRMRFGVRLRILAAPAALLAALALAYASRLGSIIEPLVPALQSNWLTFHVFTCFLGYGGFAISLISSIGFLVVSRAGSRASQETKDLLETVTDKTVSFGFAFLTLGIITGAVWANTAWGTYWSWDPKETWSLITWLIYAIYLHLRFMRGWRGPFAHWVVIIGFASVLFTYVGVNYLLPSLHSYAR